MIRTWRCRVFGHKWKAEESDYDHNIGARLQSWRDCERCDAWRETYHHSVGEVDRVLG